MVLAAGWGRRMGGPKALLSTPDGRTFLETVADGVRGARVARMVVVVGPWWDGGIGPDGCDLIVNPDPDRGIISSLRLALGRPPPHEHGVFVALVDHPAVCPETYRIIAETHREEPRRIVIPVFREGSGVHRGHPVVFPAWVVAEFFSPRAEVEGPRAVVRAHPEAIHEVEVSDPGVVMDMDAPTCYQQWLRRENGS